MKRVTIRSPISDDLAAPIGRVIIEWARLEGTVHLAFIQCLGLAEKPGRAIAGNIRRASVLFKIIEQVVDLTDEQRAYLSNTKNCIKALEKERNEVTHRFWLQGESGTIDGFQTTHAKEVATIERDATYFSCLAERICSANDQLLAFWLEIFEQQPS